MRPNLLPWIPEVTGVGTPVTDRAYANESFFSLVIRCNRSQGRSRKNAIRSVFAEFFFGIYWLKEESVRLSTKYRRIQMAHIIDGRRIEVFLEMESVCF